MCGWGSPWERSRYCPALLVPVTAEASRGTRQEGEGQGEAQISGLLKKEFLGRKIGYWRELQHHGCRPHHILGSQNFVILVLRDVLARPESRTQMPVPTLPASAGSQIHPEVK